MNPIRIVDHDEALARLLSEGDRFSAHLENIGVSFEGDCQPPDMLERVLDILVPEDTTGEAGSDAYCRDWVYNSEYALDPSIDDARKYIAWIRKQLAKHADVEAKAQRKADREARKAARNV